VQEEKQNINAGSFKRLQTPTENRTPKHKIPITSFNGIKERTKVKEGIPSLEPGQ
jgi:hypothetical protein